MKHVTSILIVMLLALAGCAEHKDLKLPPVPMGQFLLGHNIVVAKDASLGPFSRKAPEEDWVASLKEAVDERFGRYDGDQYYHIAIKVDGYVLALPGIPFVASPKSALFISVTVWDDALGTKINEKPKRFTVFERFSGETFISSGLTQSKEKQMRNLSRNAAKAIHNWMLKNQDWFAVKPVDGEVIESAPQTN